MWRQIAGQPSDVLTRPDEDEEEELLPSHLNTNNFGNFLHVSANHLAREFADVEVRIYRKLWCPCKTECAMRVPFKRGKCVQGCRGCILAFTTVILCAISINQDPRFAALLLTNVLRLVCAYLFDVAQNHGIRNKGFLSAVQVEKDKLTVKYTGQGQHNNDVGAIQGNRPVPRKRRVYYYEVGVLDAGDRGLIGVGFADKNFKMGKQPGCVLHAQPNHPIAFFFCVAFNVARHSSLHQTLMVCMLTCRWEPHSYGYHGDDGKKFHSNGQGEEYGPHFSVGDVIGAGIHIQKQEMFFT